MARELAPPGQRSSSYWGRYAPQREQAPSPQAYLSQLFASGCLPVPGVFTCQAFRKTRDRQPHLAVFITICRLNITLLLSAPLDSRPLRFLLTERCYESAYNDPIKYLARLMKMRNTSAAGPVLRYARAIRPWPINSTRPSPKSAPTARTRRCRTNTSPLMSMAINR